MVASAVHHHIASARLQTRDGKGGESGDTQREQASSNGDEQRITELLPEALR